MWTYSLLKSCRRETEKWANFTAFRESAGIHLHLRSKPCARASQRERDREKEEQTERERERQRKSESLCMNHSFQFHITGESGCVRK